MFESCTLGAGADQWSWLIPLIIVVVLSFVTRRHKPAEKTPNEISSSLLTDLMASEKTLQSFSTQRKPRKVSIGSWKRNSEKLEFLEPELRSTLTRTFTQLEDFNMRVDSAKMYKSDSYLFGVNIDRLEEPIKKSREGLEEWIKNHMEQSGPDAGRQGCAGGGLMGGGLLGG